MRDFVPAALDEMIRTVFNTIGWGMVILGTVALGTILLAAAGIL